MDGMSQTVTIREVNQHTSAIFQRVRQGEQLIVTNAGQPQARIIPYHPLDRYEQMIADGRITPASRHGYRSERSYAVTVDIDRLLDDERDERDFL
jgi:prevent-host-death family protein